MKQIKLSIVIPCFNEEKNIPLLIKRLQKILDNKSYEVILVDNGSKDNSNKLIKEYIEKYNTLRLVVVRKNIGYGNGIYAGIKNANGEYIAWTHADLQTDPNDIIKALEIIKKQKNPRETYVKGKRFGRPFFDIFFTFGMSVFETLMLKKFLYDINAQPNLFHKEFLKKIKNPPKDFSFDLYFYYMAKINNLKIIRFQVFFRKRIHGHSKWNFGFQSKIKFIKRTIDFTFKLKSWLKNNIE